MLRVVYLLPASMHAPFSVDESGGDCAQAEEDVKDSSAPPEKSLWILFCADSLVMATQNQPQQANAIPLTPTHRIEIPP